MELSIRPMTEQEHLYCYTQSSQLRGQTGCIGYLRADLDRDEQSFLTSWHGFQSNLNTEEFRQEFEEVLDKLRFSESGDAFLKNRTSLGKYCYSHPESVIDSIRNDFGFRVDTEKHTYMMRLHPNKGEYGLYCYCYERDWLDGHMREAERGIRFIDARYNNLFWLKDGGMIRITWPDGSTDTRTCRYIDSTHLQVGQGALSIYHICEFAEAIENGKGKVEPLSGLMPSREARERSAAT